MNAAYVARVFSKSENMYVTGDGWDFQDENELCTRIVQGIAQERDARPEDFQIVELSLIQTDHSGNIKVDLSKITR